ncbi:uncharacterized protein PV09_09299 [Verruconis gallopava]|uniref:ER membrane protein complex subunit 7 beta-sandwich domain-containing protein n=1 Tax=Verruconis gallopava TaxID=253628 RepID=A0A0D1ZY08_9PEZI|nr:uncharacterized protein PV09_09299 [Verruconis gallopava]KIV98969.1 hypothetical protein PV09_09299 [Verruconis gallopava]
MVPLNYPLAFVTLLLPITLAAQIAVSISHPTFPFSASTLSSSTSATLHAAGASLRTVLNRNNKFVFGSVPFGSYLLEIHSREFVFEPLRIDITDVDGKNYIKSWQTFQGNEWDNKGEIRGESDASVAGSSANTDVYVNVLGVKDYYAKRLGFSIMSLLSNPMILIAFFSLALLLGMPYLVENMDEETKAEFEAMQKERRTAANPAAAMQNFDLAGWMAGSKPEALQTSTDEATNEGQRRRKG